MYDWHNKQHFRADGFFVLDRVAGMLTLLRLDKVLTREEVTEVIEVHGWHRTRDAEGSFGVYLREVTVLTRDPTGQFTRLPVVIAGHGMPVRLIAEAIATAFAVPHRKIVQSLFGGSWRRHSVPMV